MYSKLTRERNWKSYLLVVIAIMMFSSSAFAIKVCNKSNKKMRVAKVTIESQWDFNISCAISNKNCRSFIYNFTAIDSGYCDNFSAGVWHWLFLVVQFQNKDKTWSSASYKQDSRLLNGNQRAAGSSGFSGHNVCVKDNHYSRLLDRKIDGRIPAVSKEKCKKGYSKYPINLFVQGHEKTKYTVNLQ